jgi:hypothetical protein
MCLGIVLMPYGMITGSATIIMLGMALVGAAIIREESVGYVSGYRLPNKRILVIPGELQNDYGEFFHKQAVLCDAHLVFGPPPATAVMHANGYYLYVPAPKPPRGPSGISPIPTKRELR